MANVLPREAQKKVSRSFRARYVLVGSLALLASAIVTLLALLPAYVVVYVERTSVSGDASLAASPAGAQEKSDRDDILRAQMLLKDLSTTASSTTVGLDAIRAALEKRSKGITVQTISYVAGETGTIMVGGTAAGREDISAYATSLRADPRFKSVSIPIGDLAGTGNGRFTITLTGTF